MSYSYNELEAQRQKLRLLFIPSGLGILAETSFAILALLVLDLSDIQAGLLAHSNVGNQALQNPVPYLGQRLSDILDGLSKYHWASQLTVFLLWAVIGMLVYMFLYRLAQITHQTARSVSLGVRYMRTDHAQGLMKWMGSLHDFFMKFLLKGSGLVLVLVGTFLAFTYANLALHIGFSNAYGGLSRLSLLIGVLSAMLGMRILVIGLCFLITPFRRWYLR